MSMNRASVESFIHTQLTNSAPPWVETDILNQHRAGVVKAAELLPALGTDEKKIVSDPTTTDAGKRPKLAAFADQAAPKFAWLGRMIGDADATMTRSTTLMLAPLTTRPKDMDAKEAYGREQEIRREIGRDNATAELLRAVGADDLESTRAILDAPGKPWVSPDVRHRAEEAFAQRTSPELFAKRRSVEFLRDHLAALAEMIRQWLVGLGANAETVAKTLNLK